VRATVLDDGTGFDTAQAFDGRCSSAGLGLLGMRERAKLAGATLSIRSRPASGTRVAVTLRGEQPPAASTLLIVAIPIVPGARGAPAGCLRR